MTLGPSNAEQATARDTLTVSALNRAVAGLLARGFPLARVRGEVSGFLRAASGHWYFTLKDAGAQVRCVMFRARNALVPRPPRDGDLVDVLAQVALYEARGEYQLTIESLQASGPGRLFEEFLRRRDRLAAQGLFDEAIKRSVPAVPRAIGIVTSVQAAALRDVVTTLRRRAPQCRMVIYPVPVQGMGAGAEIAAMLRTVSRRAEVDVVVLVRGGGSIEDLWAFNEESVARAIRACAVPVVVGVGHETDFTIACFAADVRAPTPTAAAELVAVEQLALAKRIDELHAGLLHRLQQRLQAAQQRTDWAQRVLAGPRPLHGLGRRIAELRARLDGGFARTTGRARAALAARVQARMRTRPRADALRARVAQQARALETATRQALTSRAARLAALRQAFDHLDPRAVLERGYSIVRDADGHVIRDVRDIALQEELQVTFAVGSAKARVESKEDSSGN